MATGIEAPSHLNPVGKRAFEHYITLLPDFPDLAATIAEVEQLQREVFSLMSNPDPATQRLYLSLVNKRVDLLTVAGLTPKSMKQISGEAPKLEPAAASEDSDDDKFLRTS